MLSQSQEKQETLVGKKDPAWYLATTLNERIAATHVQTRNEQTDGDLELIERRFKRWLSVLAEDVSLLERRLSEDSLSEDDLRVLLGESALAVSERFSEPPEWLEELLTICSTTVPPDRSLLQKMQAILKEQARSAQANPAPSGPDELELPRGTLMGLLVFAEPFIYVAEQHLAEGIQKIYQRTTDMPFDPGQVIEMLFPNLLPRLIGIISRTLVLHVNILRLLGQLEGDTPESRYESYTRRIQQPEERLDLLKRYPVLARDVLILVEQWTKNSLQFLQRLSSDWADIKQTFSPQENPGLLIQIEGGAGDPHQDGQSVMIATFRSGLCLVYKPRSLAIEAHFQQFLTWVNERGDHPPFKTLHVLDRPVYGWVEYVRIQSCSSKEEIQRFYTRQGAYLALLYLLEATDFHFENLIAVGEHPMLIDLESIFHPYVERDLLKLKTAESIAGDAFRTSVMRAMLLPQRVFGDAGSEGADWSGLGGAAGQLTPTRVLQIEDFNTDTVHFARKRVPMPGGKNRPTLNGEEVDVSDYGECILSGFRSMYQLLLYHREELLAAERSPLTLFAQDKIRVIMRATQQYMHLIQEGHHPNALQNALERERLFDRLWVDVLKLPNLEKVIFAERADMLRGDIPLFTTRVNSRDLYTSRSEILPDFFDKTGMELVHERLHRFSEHDLKQQCWFINASLLTLALGDTRQRPVHKVIPQETVITQLQERLLQEARKLGDHFQETAYQGQHDVTWIGPTLIDEHTWYLTPLSMDFYSGLPGVILFLAYLGHVTGEKQYSELARRAVPTLRNQITILASAQTDVGLTCWGGLLYLFAHLGMLWQDPTLWQEAEEIVKLLPPLIEKDARLDVLNGTAGCIAGLLALYDCQPLPATLACALQCGEHLIECAKGMEVGIGWICSELEPQPLTGFSHGTAGIAWALLHLYGRTNEKRFLDTAQAALTYERSLYVPEVKNWLDIRINGREEDLADVPLYSVYWCHGAPGIALARLDTLQYLDDDIIREEINAALETTLRSGFGETHSLCHGDMGNLETLLAAGQILDDSTWQRQTYQVAAGVLQSVNEHGWLCGVPRGVETPGIMQGLAGIGYELLRLSRPEQVPSVLMFAPPRHDAEV